MQENAEYTFKLGIVDGQLISVEEVKQLATMPSKEQIFSKLLFLINAPAQRLVTVMNAAGRDLAVVVNQAVEQGKFAAAAAPAKPVAVEAAPVAEAPKAEPAPAQPVAVEAAETPKSEPEAAPAAEATPETISPAAEASGTQEDSQTAAAATEAPTEG